MKFFDSRYAQLAAYVLIVLLAVVGFMRLETQQDKIESLIKQRTEIRNAQAAADCENQRITRDGLRNSVMSTADLGNRLIGEGDAPGQVAARAQIQMYVQDQLAALPPIVCPVPPSPPVSVDTDG